SLVIPGVIWSAPALLTRNRRAFTAAALLLFGCSWVSELVARTTGVQIVSIGLALLGMMQLRASAATSRTESNFDVNRAGVPSVDSSSCLPLYEPGIPNTKVT